jgi:phosphate/sulfate permease
MGDILLAWLLTVPASAAIAAGLFFLIDFLIG